MKFKEQVPQESSKKGKLLKAVRIFALGSILASGTTQAEEAISLKENQPPELTVRSEKKGVQLEKENDWIEYAKQDPEGVLFRMPEIIHAPYAFRVAETAINIDPRAAFTTHEHYKDLDGSNKLLEGAAKLLLAEQDEEERIDNATFMFMHIEILKDLENFEQYAKEIAEQSSYKARVMSMHKLFDNLPRSIAESIAEEACNIARTEDPFILVSSAPEIKKYLPNSKFLVEEAVNNSVHKNVGRVYSSLEIFMRAVPENEQAAFAETIMRLDPVKAYESYSLPAEAQKIDEFTGKLISPLSTLDTFTKILYESSSPEAVILRQIALAKIPSEIKYKLPLLMDELVFNKRFTIEEAAKIVENKEALLRVIGEITKRKNYIGSESIKHFLSRPVSNEIHNGTE